MMEKFLKIASLTIIISAVITGTVLSIVKKPQTTGYSDFVSMGDRSKIDDTIDSEEVVNNSAISKNDNITQNTDNSIADGQAEPDSSEALNETENEVMQNEEPQPEEVTQPLEDTRQEENTSPPSVAAEEEEPAQPSEVVEEYVVPEPVKGVPLTDEQTKIIVEKNKSLYYTEAKSVANLINTYRAECGIAPLAYDDALENVAMHRAIENAWVECFQTAIIDGKSHHIRPNGLKASTVFSVYGLSGSYAENMGCYQMSPYEIVLGEQGWKYSESHNALMLNETYIRLGVGVAKDDMGEFYWIAVFSR